MSIIYITATPIGALNDASIHMQEALATADLIICEDTRSTQKLLKALNIKNPPMESLHAHNERQKAEHLIQRIINDRIEKVVLVSDAGTPAISDPGSYLISLAHSQGITVKNIPGPSSLVCAIASSGFIQPKTLFVGFLPRKKEEQIREFNNWFNFTPCLIVFFENPNRLKKTLAHLLEVFDPKTPICLSREISKKFEENTVKSLLEMNDYLDQKSEILGECVITLNLGKKNTQASETLLLNNIKEDCKLFAQKYDVLSKDLYNFIMKHKSK